MEAYKHENLKYRGLECFTWDLDVPKLFPVNKETLCGIIDLINQTIICLMALFLNLGIKGGGILSKMVRCLSRVWIERL